VPTTGNFTWRDEFDGPTLNPAWIFARVPREQWADLRAKPGALTIHPLAESLDTLKNPSFLARRQQHIAFDASTSLQLPATGHVAAGLAAFQNENYWYFLGARRSGNGVQVFLERRDGKNTTTVATATIPAADSLAFKVSANGPAYSFLYASRGGDWRTLRAHEDGTLLSTDVAGGFIGATLGPYARAEP
jgi:alpha-N-arabinofuranosidase